ncbi:alpha/beta hydrolase family protein [Marininema halotolerans]|uniref:Acetyl esterase/lipase n=1 Tax=Marininema halotolerans TaxID=1155944 RepID=A0A1I6QKK9_9BACL|nr:alpha/beta hydrolase [Marininema halotolerans]SFS52778.1 Acetyl esterase/lipase [Marininema halotolerans]
MSNPYRNGDVPLSEISSFRIPYGNHPSQYGDLRLPTSLGRSPIVVSIHGGFWQSKYGLELNDPIVEDLTRRGYATWNIEYRRVGENGGGWTGTFDDVIDAINQLTQLEKSYPLDLSRIVILGHSAGGHLALWLASRNHTQNDAFEKTLRIPIKHVISLAGITDLKRTWEIHLESGLDGSLVSSFLDGTPHEVPDRYRLASPIEQLPIPATQLLIHGELDRHVPVELSIAYHQKAVEQGAHVRLLTLPEAEHFQLIDPASSAWKSVIDSLETLFSE